MMKRQTVGRITGNGQTKSNEMEFLSIFSKCGKTAESSSFSGSDGLLMVFGSFFLCLAMFILWTKTPQGRMNSVMNKVFDLALRLTFGDAQDGQDGWGRP